VSKTVVYVHYLSILYNSVSIYNRTDIRRNTYPSGYGVDALTGDQWPGVYAGGREVVGENITGVFGMLTRKVRGRVADASLESELKGFGVGSGIEGQSSIPELASS
jgi:hypothetical protein